MKIFGKILAVIYVIFFTIVLFGTNILFALSNYFKVDFMEDIFTNEAFLETRLSDITMEFDGKEEIEKLCGKDCTIKDAIISAAADGYGIKKELVEEALEDEDIQKSLSKLASTFIKFTTGVMEEINYNDYEKVLEKDVVKKILSELNISKNDVKKAIDEYNKSLENFKNDSHMGGIVNERAIIK